MLSQGLDVTLIDLACDARYIVLYLVAGTGILLGAATPP